MRVDIPEKSDLASTAVRPLAVRCRAISDLD